LAFESTAVPVVFSVHSTEYCGCDWPDFARAARSDYVAVLRAELNVTQASLLSAALGVGDSEALHGVTGQGDVWDVSHVLHQKPARL
jgi:hypothetical protein